MQTPLFVETQGSATTASAATTASTASAATAASTASAATAASTASAATAQGQQRPSAAAAGGRVRATPIQAEFSLTQEAGGTVDWLTGGSLPADFGPNSLPSSSASPASTSSSTSSLLLPPRVSRRPPPRSLLAAGFGSPRPGTSGGGGGGGGTGGVPGSLAVDPGCDLRALKRRVFASSSSSSSRLRNFHARRVVRSQKMEQERQRELRMGSDSHVRLYRSYRLGELPDIQIPHSAIIAPLQALAQCDAPVARMLLGSLLGGLLPRRVEEAGRADAEEEEEEERRVQLYVGLNSDLQRLLRDSELHYAPVFVFVQDLCCRNPDLPPLPADLVASSALASLQQASGILLLEEALLRDEAQGLLRRPRQPHGGAEEPEASAAVGNAPAAKRARLDAAQHRRWRRRQWSEVAPDTATWIQLARLYRSVSDYDSVRGIFSGTIGTKEVTRAALGAEARGDLQEAARLYEQALSTEDWPGGPPPEAETELWDFSSLSCYARLTRWTHLEHGATASFDSQRPPNLLVLWDDPFYQEAYLPWVIKARLKLLLTGGGDPSTASASTASTASTSTASTASTSTASTASASTASTASTSTASTTTATTLSAFVDASCRASQRRRRLLESAFGPELAALHLAHGRLGRAASLAHTGMRAFLQEWASVDAMHQESRLQRLQSLQALTELSHFINFLSHDSNFRGLSEIRRLTSSWMRRLPDPRLDSISTWDDVITNRCFFIGKMRERLREAASCGGGGDEDDEVVVVKEEEEEEEEEEDVLLDRCVLHMKLRLANSAQLQGNSAVADSVLKASHSLARQRPEWLVAWSHSYSLGAHGKSRRTNNTNTSSSRGDSLKLLANTLRLLEESGRSACVRGDCRLLSRQHGIVGDSCRLLGNAVASEPEALGLLKPERAADVLRASGIPAGDADPARTC
uniref:DNA-dependent protein kinase catalytic subunit-like n=1 Tax=Petromyzon marinus TaxID=7757 RepID=A0AAJ7SL59_PETMA|nr:DNA-dependent protein kinase catalytic subunit-like [Petromyzon marinus]